MKRDPSNSVNKYLHNEGSKSQLSRYSTYLSPTQQNQLKHFQ